MTGDVSPGDGQFEDARFEDGAELPLRLRAETAEDLTVLSALLQDAVGSVGDIAWMRRRRRFAALLGRFRWEDARKAERQGRPVERVRCLLTVDDALAVRGSGIDPAAKDLVVAVLALTFSPGEDGGGVLTLVLSGDGEIAITVEALSVSLTDVTQPYVAPSGRKPEHRET